LKIDKTLTIAFVALALSIIAIGAVAFPSLSPLFQRPQSTTPQTLQGCPKPPSGYLLLTADEAGFNDSASRHTYPVITAKEGSTVYIQFCNLSTVQPFGLGIEHYLGGAVIARPGRAMLIEFQASAAGNFTLFSPIFTTAELYTRGVLVVKP